MIALLADHRFGANHLGNKLLGQGWAPPEDGFVWSLGRQSTLVLPQAAGPGRLVLELTVDPFRRPPQVRHQLLRVSVNGEAVGDRRLGGALTWWLEVPARAAQGALHITLHQPDATSPLALGVGRDGRPLGFRLSRAKLLRVRTAPPAARGMTQTRFGCNETTEGWLEDGFGEPEGGYVWALGRRSVLRIPADGSGQPILAALDMRPFLDPPHAVRQRLAVGQDGRLLTYLDLQSRTVVGLRLTPRPGQHSVLVQFDHLDAEAGGARLRYDDGRPLAYALDNVRLFSAPPAHAPASMAPVNAPIEDGSMAAHVRKMTGLELSELAACFESFGNGCGFGLVQQRLGHDQPALLRFAGCWQPALVAAFANGFAGLGRPDALYFDIRAEIDQTWRLIDTVYGLSIPTPYNRFVPPPGDAIARAGRTLPRLAEKLLEDAANGDKIFAFRTDVPMLAEGAVALRAMLGAIGDVTLLWITDGTDAQCGGVERIGHRLLRGYAVVVDGPDEHFVSIMANAWILSQAERGNATAMRKTRNTTAASFIPIRDAARSR